MQAVVIIGANKMLTRKPVVAGQFYPAQHDGCVDEINEYLEEVPANKELPDTIAAGIVPHAGWTFSAALAAAVFSAINSSTKRYIPLSSLGLRTAILEIRRLSATRGTG